MKHFSLTENILVKMKQVEDELGINQEIQKISCEKLTYWHARPTLFSNNQYIQSLQKSIANLGQLQPIIVVKKEQEGFRGITNEEAEYIIIDGFKRYKICNSLNKPIDIIIKNINLSNAVHHSISETLNKNLSEYELGMFYHQLLKEKYISPQALIEQVAINLPKLNRLLIFAKLPIELVEAIGSLAHVSYKTAIFLVKVCQLGIDYQKALITIANKIRTGLSEKKIKKILKHNFLLPLPSDDITNENQYRCQLKDGNMVIMDCKNNIIKLNKQLAQQEDYDQLINCLSQVIKNWNASK